MYVPSYVYTVQYVYGKNVVTMPTVLASQQGTYMSLQAGEMPDSNPELQIYSLVRYSTRMLYNWIGLAI